MKINIYIIFRDHINTFYDYESNSKSLFDFVLFYGLPIVLSLLSFYFSITMKSDYYNLSITFYGIFLALLLNIQVAIFSIYQREWRREESDRDEERVREKRENKRIILTELNSNISYMTALSCIALAAFLVFYALEINNSITAAISIFFYSHFILTFLMVIKRSHALFSHEYKVD